MDAASSQCRSRPRGSLSRGCRPVRTSNRSRSAHVTSRAEYSVIQPPKIRTIAPRIALERTGDFHRTLTHRMLRRDSPWSRSRRSSPLRRRVPWPAGQRIACGLLLVLRSAAGGRKLPFGRRIAIFLARLHVLAHSETEIFRKRFSYFPDTVLGWLVAHGLPSYPPDPGHGRFLCVPGMGPLSGITQGRARSAEATDI